MPQRYGNSHAIWDHTVLDMRILPLHQPKHVLHLATLEGCKAELTYVA